MDQKAFYAMVEKAGAKVSLFEDHPGFFGNWRAIVLQHHKTLEIVSDHREGWIQLLEIQQGHTNIERHSLNSSKFNESDELLQIQIWLAEVSRA